jgi:hypothetical protein
MRVWKLLAREFLLQKNFFAPQLALHMSRGLPPPLAYVWFGSHYWLHSIQFRQIVSHITLCYGQKVVKRVSGRWSLIYVSGRWSEEINNGDPLFMPTSLWGSTRSLSALAVSFGVTWIPLKLFSLHSSIYSIEIKIMINISVDRW